jgi:hypothetical protein
MAVGFATQGIGTAGTVASTLKVGSTAHNVSRSFSPAAQSLSASDAVTFTVKSGDSYEQTKYVGVDTALTSPAPQASALAAS